MAELMCGKLEEVMAGDCTIVDAKAYFDHLMLPSTPLWGDQWGLRGELASPRPGHGTPAPSTANRREDETRGLAHQVRRERAVGMTRRHCARGRIAGLPTPLSLGVDAGCQISSTSGGLGSQDQRMTSASTFVDLLMPGTFGAAATER